MIKPFFRYYTWLSPRIIHIAINSTGTFVNKSCKTLSNAYRQNQDNSQLYQVKPSTSLQKLWVILSPEKSRLKLAFAAMSISSGVTLSIPKFLGVVVDAFGLDTNNNQSSLESAIQLASEQSAFVALSVGIGAIASGIRLFLLESASDRIAFRLRIQLFENMMKQKMEHLEQIKTGEFINRLSGDITVTSRILHDMSFGIRNAILSTISTIAIISLVPLSLVGIIIVPIMFVVIIGKIFGKLIKQLATTKQDKLAFASSLAEERFHHLKTVRMYNGEPFEISQFKIAMEDVAKSAFSIALAIGTRTALFYCFGGGLVLQLIYSSGVFVAKGVLSMGHVTSLILYAMMAGGGYHGLITAYGDYQKALGSCEKVLTMIENKNGESQLQLSHLKNYPVLYPTTYPIKFHNKDTTIRFQNVSFHYPSRPDHSVIHNFNLDIPSGKTVAIVGESGCGKSTLIDLLLRLYEPTKGKIFVGGIDISTKHPIWLRSQFGVVNQEPTLFSMSLRDNILYGKLTEDYLQQEYFKNIQTKNVNLYEEMITSSPPIHNQLQTNPYDIELERVLDLSQVNNFIYKLPEGIHTMIGGHSIMLSGGEKQRVCIARALAKQTKFILFDELTSALDSHADDVIHKTLSDALKHSTILLITHRLSALQYADLIAVIQSGTVVQFGEKEDILNHPGPELQRILYPSIIT